MGLAPGTDAGCVFCSSIPSLVHEELSKTPQYDDVGGGESAAAMGKSVSPTFLTMRKRHIAIGWGLTLKDSVLPCCAVEIGCSLFKTTLSLFSSRHGAGMQSLQGTAA